MLILLCGHSDIAPVKIKVHLDYRATVYELYHIFNAQSDRAVITQTAYYLLPHFKPITTNLASHATHPANMHVRNCSSPNI